MAKVLMPLMSGSASGRFGAIVFDKRSIVRVFVQPANPKTVAQMAVRNTMGDLQRSLKPLGVVLRGQLKTGFGARWNTAIIGELMANDNAALTAYTAEFTAFTAPQKAEWAAVDVVGPLKLTAGAALYAAASAAYDIAIRLGAVITLTLPAAANAATVGAEWVDNVP
jgi:hypothetical protein